MLTKHFLLSAAAVFIFIVAYEWAVHGSLLYDQYAATANVWRPQGELEAASLFSLGTQLALSLLITWVFIQNFEKGGAVEGTHFGLYVGLFLGLIQFGFYPYLPIPLSLGVAWLIAGIVEGVGIGLLLSFVYKE